MNHPASFTGKVSPEWLTRGVWLADAPVIYADASVANVHTMMLDGAARFAELRNGELASDFRDDDSVRMLRGAERDAWKMYRGGIQALQQNLRARLHFGTLIAFGDPGRPGAEPEWIPVRAWFHLKFADDLANKVSGAAGSYYYVRVVDLAQEDRSVVSVLNAPSERKKNATADQIDDALRHIYANDGKPPNLAELYAPVNEFLARISASAKKADIVTRAGGPEFAHYRRPPGRQTGAKSSSRNSSQTYHQEN